MISHLDSNWKQALSFEFDQAYFKTLINRLNELYADPNVNISPKINDVFSAFNSCSLKDVKVVIIGQDPYPTSGHAHGLCFSVHENVHPLPKSLVNIFKEIKNDLGKEIPQNGSLLRWAEQGVFLLNAVLTVEVGKPESHYEMGWENFTDAVINKINESDNAIVFMLWGNKAKLKAKNVNQHKHLVLESSHPSPLAVYRGFFNCKHFSKANDFLLRQGYSPILW